MKRPIPETSALPLPHQEGRTTKRTPERRKLLIDALKRGISLEGAARYAGICAETFRSWRVDDLQFFVECEKALGEMEVAMLAVIDRAAIADKQWQAAAWKLERRFPDNYGRRSPADPAPTPTDSDSPGKIYRVVFERPPEENDGVK